MFSQKGTAKLSSWARAIVVGLASGIAQLATGAPVPVENFTKWPAIDEVVISPSGNRLAVLVFGPEGQRRVAVMSLNPLGKAHVVGAFEDADVEKVRWVNDDRLVFESFHRGAVITARGAGTFAVNHDGSRLRSLINWAATGDEPTGSSIRQRVLPYGWSLYRTVDDGSDDVIVKHQARRRSGALPSNSFGRLNTLTGELRMLSYGMPDGARNPLMDAQWSPRLVTAEEKGRVKLYWRNDEGTWNEVADFDDGTDQGFRPWLVSGPDEVLVSATVRGDALGLYKFHPSTKKLDGEPAISVSGFDLGNAVPEVDSRSGGLVGLHFKTERPVSYWFDAAIDRVQRGIDAALPGRSNRLYCGRCESTRFFVVFSSSDRQPGEYFLFDRNTTSLEKIGAARPWIDEAAQGRRSFHRYAARDGLQIPLYVTHPKGARADEPLPAVVLVHGGPWMRGSDIGWEAEAQFLASRGYRVLQPEFRGSMGYGFKHYSAGWKQWGRAMQDDLADAVQWAAQQRLIDPARVCIVGASYGGYAALMGPVVHPKVYRCAVSFAGVTDIDLMYSATWSDMSNDWRDYGMPVKIGDPKKDREALDAVSPVKRVADIKVPVLLLHGGLDRRVPIDHARRFADAARQAGVALEQVVYPQEPHGFSDPANEADYFTQMERFLEKWTKPRQ